MNLTPGIRFGSIRGARSASFTFSRGVSPSVCTLTVLPTAQFDRQPKPLVFTDGERSATFRDCLVNDAVATIADDGSQVMVLTILDRRWKWKFSQISGRYNVRSGGVIVEDTKKTVRELAELCLDELGEKNYDVRKMPNDVFPHIDWDLEPCGVALDQLCQAVNCHVSLSERDTVVIYPEGVGKELPEYANGSRGVAFDFGLMPGKVGITSAPVEWQLDFDLIPVGVDTDGEIKSIYDLSYTPEIKQENGTKIKTWDTEWDPFYNVKSSARKLAQQSIWRMYMIVPPDWSKVESEEKKITVGAGSHGLTELPGVKDKLKIEAARQFFPLLDHQLDYQTVSAIDRLKLSRGEIDAKMRARKPPQVIGYFYDDQGYGSDNFTYDFSDDSDVHEQDEHLICQKSFSIDNDRGLLIFADPCFRLIDNKRVPPRIRLRCAANFHHKDTRAAYRLFQTIKVPGAPDPDLVAWSTREDTIPEIIARHDTNAGKTVFDRQDTNEREINERLKFYMGYALKKYELKTPAHSRYPFLVPFAPDGLIAQVIFEIDTRGFITTSLHKQREEISNLPTYDERRQALQAKATMDHLAAQAGAQNPKKDGK